MTSTVPVPSGKSRELHDRFNVSELLVQSHFSSSFTTTKNPAKPVAGFSDNSIAVGSTMS
jgi:hypothetical protein